MFLSGFERELGGCLVQSVVRGWVAGSSQPLLRQERPMTAELFLGEVFVGNSCAVCDILDLARALVPDIEAGNQPGSTVRDAPLHGGSRLVEHVMEESEIPSTPAHG